MFGSNDREHGTRDRAVRSSTSNDGGQLPDRIDELIDLEHRWRPFGGVPEEEIFVRFGISKASFDALVGAAAGSRTDTSRARTGSATRPAR